MLKGLFMKSGNFKGVFGAKFRRGWEKIEEVFLINTVPERYIGIVPEYRGIRGFYP